MFTVSITFDAGQNGFYGLCNFNKNVKFTKEIRELLKQINSKLEGRFLKIYDTKEELITVLTTITKDICFIQN